MPMKLNVGVSRKVGMPDYGSVGASCNLEMELDAGLLEKDLDGFHARIRSAYVAAHQAVHDELARLQVPGGASAERPSPRHATTLPRNGDAREEGNGSSARAQVDRSRVRKPATPSQVKAILAIARRQNTDLGRLLQQEYEVERPEDLTIRQASDLIDLLKAPAEA
ncbi:MAG TPA: hypothetical protein VJY33_17865 [Isosphaeraceae bacterium]|nr:hypothetical protein [Isosphaeraceae bacterium]